MHLTPLMITLVYAVYTFSLLGALLTVGGLSDYVGRRPVILSGLLLNAIAMVLFSYATDVGQLILARAVQGLCVGTATPVLGAAILDTDHRRGPLLNSVTAFLGLTAGARKFHIDVEWVELSLLDQFEAVAIGKVDAAFCRLPLSHDGLVQCTVLLEEKKKLVVPAGHRLSDRELIDPEELALETLPTLPDNHQLGAWAAIHFPDHTPSGRPIARGPVVTTIRECLAVVESGEAVVIVGARAEHYYSNPRIRFIEIGVPPVGTALVRRRADRRRVIQDLEECSRDVVAGLVDAVEH
jgi:DNA-binding transcriptional LysR family regulator